MVEYVRQEGLDDKISDNAETSYDVTVNTLTCLTDYRFRLCLECKNGDDRSRWSNIDN